MNYALTMNFIGRLRVLVSGRILVETKTATENIIGDYKTASACSVKAPLFMDKSER